MIWIVLSIYGSMSLVTFGVFAFDKWRARREGRRVPERTLHILSLLGGVPGALAAMPMLRHKNRKPSFWLVTAAIALLHAAAWGVYLFRDSLFE
jgi:uncharacterized membrane protein YsdA (DUF1294 family)